jgi:hypothetical protein
VSIVTILIIIGVISSVINAMQPKKGTRPGQWVSRLKQMLPSINDQTPPLKRTVVGTHERRGRLDQVATPVRYSSPTTKSVDLKLEDKEVDFGDPPTIYSPLSALELGASSPNVSSKRWPLDLKPTPKKLAETLILAEILSEPRAKRPYHPLGYKKK